MLNRCVPGVNIPVRDTTCGPPRRRLIYLPSLEHLSPALRTLDGPPHSQPFTCPPPPLLRPSGRLGAPPCAELLACPSFIAATEQAARHCALAPAACAPGQASSPRGGVVVARYLGALDTPGPVAREPPSEIRDIQSGGVCERCTSVLREMPPHGLAKCKPCAPCCSLVILAYASKSSAWCPTAGSALPRTGALTVSA